MARVVDHCLCFNSFWIITSKHELNKKKSPKSGQPPSRPNNLQGTDCHTWLAMDIYRVFHVPSEMSRRLVAVEGSLHLGIVGSVGHRFQEQFLFCFKGGGVCAHTYEYEWLKISINMYIYIHIVYTLCFCVSIIEHVWLNHHQECTEVVIHGHKKYAGLALPPSASPK